MLALSVHAVAGQQPAPQTPTFRSGVNLVEVAAVVRDREGRPIKDLTAADFEIRENGVLQQVAAFTRVTIPIVKPEAAPVRDNLVASDVATNEGGADGRVYVLVLDALHVSPRGVGAVQRFARQFIEQHVGPHDLVAVLSPGGLAAATQDFTNDKARLLAAVDSFTATKMRSATVEIEEERQQAAVTGVMPHGGKDPSDHERADRAQALASTLDALAGHLGRVERRRKTLLLFSEGIDYNTADVMGSVQRHASDVIRGMNRAVTGLMRTNVSLYAIDPRALSASDGAGNERIPYVTAPNAPRADGTTPRLDFSEPTLEAEYAASLQSLRHVADSTGGFAFVTSNDLAGAFERIVEESSNYYVLGYTPVKPAAPGEFREISVRVARPGTTVIARKGYGAPAAERRLTAAPIAEPALPPGMGNRPRAGLPPPRAIETPAPEIRGVDNELTGLLASPLPARGLAMRVHAASFRGNTERASVQVIIELLGRTIALTERGSRFEGRVELALLTIDDRGRAGNGRSTAIDVRLTPEEAGRVRTTGLRWVSALQLAPGRHQLRVAARDVRGGATGLVTSDILVPAFERGAVVSSVTLTSLPSVLMVTRGDYRLAAALETPPTAARTFVAGDRIVAAAEVYPSSSTADVTVQALVERHDGTIVLRRQGAASRTDRARHAEIAFPIPTDSLEPGRYVLRIGVADRPQRAVPFEIVKKDR